MDTSERRQAIAFGVVLLVVSATGVLFFVWASSQIGVGGSSGLEYPLFGTVLLLVGVYLVRFRHVVSRWTREAAEQDPISRAIVGPERYHPALVALVGLIFAVVGLWFWVQVLA